MSVAIVINAGIERQASDQVFLEDLAALEIGVHEGRTHLDVLPGLGNPLGLADHGDRALKLGQGENDVKPSVLAVPGQRQFRPLGNGDEKAAQRDVQDGPGLEFPGILRIFLVNECRQGDLLPVERPALLLRLLEGLFFFQVIVKDVFNDGG